METEGDSTAAPYSRASTLEEVISAVENAPAAGGATQPAASQPAAAAEAGDGRPKRKTKQVDRPGFFSLEDVRNIK